MKTLKGYLDIVKGHARKAGAGGFTYISGHSKIPRIPWRIRN